MNNTRSVTGIQSSVFLQRVDELSASSDKVFFLGLASALILTSVTAFFWPGSTIGIFVAYFLAVERTCLYLWAGNALKGKGGEILSGLFKLGIVAGLFELLVDWGLIQWISNGRLIYLSGNDVVLLGSPVWMPHAWALVIVEIGYISIRLFSLMKRSISLKKAAVLASILTGLAAFTAIGIYEFHAYRLGWWKYGPANAMIGDFCTLFIPVGEFIMFLFILPIASRVFSKEDVKWDRFIAGGFQFACFIAIGYFIAYMLLEFGRPV